MTWEREVPDDVGDLPRELLPQILHDGVEGATRLTLEVQELHHGDGTLASVIENMRTFSQHLRRRGSFPRGRGLTAVDKDVDQRGHNQHGYDGSGDEGHL